MNTSIQSIPVVAEGPLSDTGNVSPLLHEIRHALERLADTGAATIIDLRSLPLAPGEEDRLDAFLGKGEVNVEIEAMGRSHLLETRFPGVWVVTHYNTEQAVMAKYIEITTVPSLLATPDEDISESAARLLAEIAAQTDKDDEREREDETNV